MLKKKLDDGTIVELSVESVQGGVLITLGNIDASPDIPKYELSFMLNPVEASELISRLRSYGSRCRITSAHGRTLIFNAPAEYEAVPPKIEIVHGDENIIFPLREHEVLLIRKALESMAASLLFVGTWSGEAEALS